MPVAPKKAPTAPPPSPASRSGEQVNMASSSSDSSDDGFELATPRKRLAQGKKASSKRANNRKSPQETNHQPASTSNRYSPLTDQLATPDEQDSSPNEERPSATATTRRAPPPIILCGKPTSHADLVNYLKLHAASGFNIKYTTNNANIFVNESKERKTIIQDLIAKNKPFYTYTEKSEKTYGFVVRGLDHAPEPAELVTELKLLGVNILQAFQMKSTVRPLYLIITTADTTLASLNRDVKFIFHTRISWERHRNKKLISQCHKCQRWGHATSNCYLPPVCLKCAGPHPTSSCTKPLDTPAKCANCSEAHPANSTSCAVYKRRIEERASRQRTRKPAVPATFVDAPPPAHNAWAARTAAIQPALPAQPANTSPAPHSTRSPAPAAGPHDEPHTLQTTHIPQSNTPAEQTSSTNIRNTITNTDNEQITLLLQFLHETKTLSTLINIKNITLALKDLNNQLSSATDEVQKFFIFVNFSQDLQKYNLSTPQTN